MIYIAKETEPTSESQRKASKFAGFSLLIISVIAPVAYYGIIQKLIVPDDVSLTISNIIDSKDLFQIGIFCLTTNAVLDLLVAWALFIILKPVSYTFSLLSAWFRIAYTVMLTIALSNLLIITQLINGSDFAGIYDPAQIENAVKLLFSTFDNVWNLGYIFFGFHLISLGYLVYKANYFPRFLGVFVVIAGFGYLIDSFSIILAPDYNMNIAIYTFIGEPLLMVWLLIKGFKGFEMKTGENS